ncbi:MAG: hypothetical protein E4G95_08645 [Bacteroidia bacterium]|nr:MAG: hypothetical protein E4G95_08645 [Bacteroidia bacterium]
MNKIGFIGFITVLSLPLCFNTVAQVPIPGTVTDSVALSPDFRFRDGVFLNFEQVKSNSPIPKAKILTSAEYNDREFFNQVLESGKIYFYDALGGRQEVSNNDIWGYARNGILYVRVEDGFNRITYLGTLSHFVADVTTYDNRYYNSPYNYYNPYSYSPYYSNYYNPYNSPYNSGYPYGPTTVTKNELVQYVIDFETGKLVEYEVNNIEILLMKDTELYQEFVQMPRKKKKQMLFLYLRKYNENHPVYLPKN